MNFIARKRRVIHNYLSEKGAFPERIGAFCIYGPDSWNRMGENR